VGDGSDRVGAALIQRAGVGRADRAGQRIHAGVEGLRVMREQGGVHRRHPAPVILPDVHTAAARAGFGAAYCVGVDLGDERVDGLLRRGDRHRFPGAERVGQQAVELVQGVGVDDQGAALHHRSDELVGDQSVGEDCGHQREAFVQGDGDQQLVGRGAVGDAQGRAGACQDVCV